jgi:hypothetical protein
MNHGHDKRRSAARTPGSLEQVWQTRTEMVKQQMESESKANDAKTARLKALRLAKELEDAEAQKNAPAPKPAAKRARRVVA